MNTWILILFVALLASCKEPIDQVTQRRGLYNSLPEEVTVFVESNRDSFSFSIASQDTAVFQGVCQGDLASGEFCRVGWYSDSSTEITFKFSDGKALLYLGNVCNNTIGKNPILDHLAVSSGNTDTIVQPFCGHDWARLSGLNAGGILYTIDSVDYSFAR